jgi:hypothetical protein
MTRPPRQPHAPREPAGDAAALFVLAAGAVLAGIVFHDAFIGEGYRDF